MATAGADTVVPAKDPKVGASPNPETPPPANRPDDGGDAPAGPDIGSPMGSKTAKKSPTRATAVASAARTGVLRDIASDCGRPGHRSQVPRPARTPTLVGWATTAGRGRMSPWLQTPVRIPTASAPARPSRWGTGGSRSFA